MHNGMDASRVAIRKKWDDRYADLSPQDQVQPTPFVVGCLPRLPRRGQALDVAAGAGRHTLALAEHGLTVDAVDISERGLWLAQKLMARAKNNQNKVQFVVADIEQPWLPQGEYDVILVSFFLCRPLFPLIKDRLRAGGWLVYETFTVDEIEPSETGGVTNRAFYLEPRELLASFCDFEVEFYDEGNHVARGEGRRMRTTAQLLARKPEQG